MPDTAHLTVEQRVRVTPWDTDPVLAALLRRMTDEGLIGWRGSIGSPERHPFLRTHGREALAVLRTLEAAERATDGVEVR